MKFSLTTISRFLGFSLVLLILFSSLLPVAALQPPKAWAQTTEGCESDDPDDCNVDLGGGSISVQDIQAAIDAPTPNLANTTAYIFYTLSVIMTSTFDPNYSTKETGDKNSEKTSSSSSYPKSVSEALNRRGAVGGVGFLMAEMVRQPPASAQTYVADLFQNSRFGAGPVYAQGIGFGALTPILGTWKAFRDVAYYLLIVMFLITGFLILIRHKVSGNVAVTVQNALPRLVITLILITFSYAIAGLVVDLMFVSLYFIINLFDGAIFDSGAKFVLFDLIPGRVDAFPSEKSLADIAFDTHIFIFMLGFIFNSGSTGNENASAWSAAESLADMMWQMLDSLPGAVGAVVDVGNVLALGQLDNILQIIFALIFGIALLIAMFRTFFSLLMSYAGFVINVVLAPLILLPGAIPGKDPFFSWFKNLLAGLAPFVVAVFMIFMSLALTGVNTQPGVGYDESNPGASGLRLPLIVTKDIQPDAFIGILGMGFMLLLPEAVKMTKTLVGAKGGPFDEFKDQALANFKQGWSGNNYVPGAKSVGKFAGTTAALGTAGAISGAAYGGAQAYQGAREQGRSGWGAAVRGGLTGGIYGGAAGAAILPAAKIIKPAINTFKELPKTIAKYDAPAAELLRANQLRQQGNRLSEKGTSQEQKVNKDNIEIDMY